MTAHPRPLGMTEFMWQLIKKLLTPKTCSIVHFYSDWKFRCFCFTIDVSSLEADFREVNLYNIENGNKFIQIVKPQKSWVPLWEEFELTLKVP